MNKEEIKIKKAYDRGYIERDRQAREICKTCIYQTRYKELTKKEETLDKVTELATKIATENAEKYNSENQKEVDFSEWNLALEILNIIEGGNGQCR